MSRLPSSLRILILVVLSLGIRSTVLSAATNFLGEELGKISRKEADIYHVAGFLTYKILVLLVGWFLHYDFLDISSLTLVANAPLAYLLTTYYQISTLTISANVVAEIISIALPTYLLRPRSDVHNPNAPLPNRFLLNSFQVQTSTGIMSVGVYVAVIWIALQAQQLNEFLVSHFEIPTLELAHKETPITLIAKMLPVGIAAKGFLLNPSIGAQPASGAATPVVPFDPASATLPETLRYNFWFWSKRTKTLVRQTVVLSIFILANTIQRTLTIRGTDPSGAVGYASIWILATMICAGWSCWVADTES
ncbi:uncharacterized protein BDR25DRAFT_299990 [Lindgomyces ingoldianus]|uniref:Uncharacterized protein n=1 Tax=Lindgomyces ingoldianus TaxID=673940 RepID=A0ACB6RCN7_9PLEO|nr:uncharacterized protein BDR25DRAFT_299990 [Lindgomyces ingoldianus]KAF2476820.1 hypothetical protein BDR25DRAFT_299990 [Lindgomyces ingoldianus]